MNKDRAKEELRDRKILAEIEYNQSEDAKKKNNLLRYIQALDIAIECIANAEIDNKIIKMQHDRIQELKDNEWVDVRDRLPSEDKLVVCVDKDNNYYLAYFDYDKDCFVHYDETTIKGSENIIAWKIIEPYERKE